MVTIIKKGMDKKEIEKLFSSFDGNKKFDAYKFCGIIQLKDDPMDIQKSMRDEWK